MASESDHLNGVQMTWRRYGCDSQVCCRFGLQKLLATEQRDEHEACSSALGIWDCHVFVQQQVSFEVNSRWIDKNYSNFFQVSYQISIDFLPLLSSCHIFLSISCRIWKWDPLAPPRMAARGAAQPVGWLFHGKTSIVFRKLKVTPCVVKNYLPIFMHIHLSSYVFFPKKSLTWVAGVRRLISTPRCLGSTWSWWGGE